MVVFYFSASSCGKSRGSRPTVRLLVGLLVLCLSLLVICIALSILCKFLSLSKNICTFKKLRRMLVNKKKYILLSFVTVQILTSDFKFLAFMS